MQPQKSANKERLVCTATCCLTKLHGFAWAPRQQHLSPQRRGLARPVRWDRVEEPPARHLRISRRFPPQRRCTARTRRRLGLLRSRKLRALLRSLSFPPRSGHIDWESVAQEHAVTTSSSPTGTEEAYSPPRWRSHTPLLQEMPPALTMLFRVATRVHGGRRVGGPSYRRTTG